MPLSLVPARTVTTASLRMDLSATVGRALTPHSSGQLIEGDALLGTAAAELLRVGEVNELRPTSSACVRNPWRSLAEIALPAVFGPVVLRLRWTD